MTFRPTGPPIDPHPTVAVVRSDRRRGAVAEALALLGDAPGSRLLGRSVLLPDVHPGRTARWASTHADAISAVLDVVLARGSSAAATILAEADDLDRLGYRGEASGRPVDFASPSGFALADLLDSPDRPTRPQALDGASVVSLATMKTHGASGVALGLANLWALATFEARQHLQGRADRPEGRPSWDRPGAWSGALARAKGVFRWLDARRDDRDAWRAFGAREVEVLRRAESSGRALASIARAIGPTLSVVDGFDAIAGEGPTHGRRHRLNVVVAGVDPVAVDAVAARIMGIRPGSVAHIRLAEAAGVGVARLDAIRVVGDPIEPPRAIRVAPHSAHAILKHGERLAELSETREATIPAPHARPARLGEVARR